MGLFVIGEINSDEILDLITKYFGEFENSTETEDPNYKIPDFKENQFFSYQDAVQEDIVFGIWKKDDFKRYNTIENFRYAIINYLADDIYNRRLQEINELNQSAFNQAYIYEYQVSDLDMYYLYMTTLKQNSIMQGIEDSLTIAEQINRYGFLENELELAKKKTSRLFKTSFY